MLEPTLYVTARGLTGPHSSHRRMGFVEIFLHALITTPFVALPVLPITGTSRRIEWHRQ
jgi:hypothetical protein